MAENSVRPFSSGSQYGDWTDSNCRTCDLRWREELHTGLPCPCGIEQALLVACFGDGRIPLAIADRMGHGEGRYGWPCREHSPPFVNGEKGAKP